MKKSTRNKVVTPPIYLTDCGRVVSHFTKVASFQPEGVKVEQIDQEAVLWHIYDNSLLLRNIFVLLIMSVQVPVPANRKTEINTLPRHIL